MAGRYFRTSDTGQTVSEGGKYGELLQKLRYKAHTKYEILSKMRAEDRFLALTSWTAGINDTTRIQAAAWLRGTTSNRGGQTG